MAQSHRRGFVLFGILLVAVLIWKIALIYTEYLWFDSLSFAPVFTTMIRARVLLGVVLGVAFFVLLYANLRLARRLTPSDVTFIGHRLLPPAEREQIEAYADRALLLVSLAGGVLAGLVAGSRWAIYLKFVNAVPFGDTDPIFHRDLGFYVFQLPFLNYIWSSVFSALAVTFLATTLVYVYEETIHMAGNALRVAPHVRLHLSVILAAALLWKAGGYWLSRFGLLLSTRSDRFSGATYADVHAKLPALGLLIVLAIVCAVLLLATIRGRSLKAPGFALGLLLAASLLGGSVIPTAVHRLIVLPTELEKEQPFLEHNIEFTNKAYGLPLAEGRVERELEVSYDLTARQIQLNRPTIDNVRLWDERPLSQTYGHLQTLRNYYQFAGVDVDRYTIDGKYQQVMLSARQMAPPKSGWQNEKLVFTHGYGLCMSPVMTKNTEGLPEFLVKNIPVAFPKGLEVEPRYCGLYYQAGDAPRTGVVAPMQPTPGGPPQGPGGPPQGPGGPAPPPPPEQRMPGVGIEADYAIVNTDADELDYPVGDKNQMTKYAGKGDVLIGSFWRKLLFTLRFFPDFQILLTSYINQGSRIQLHRMVEERVATLAPFLALDRDPYIVIADGRLKWILDAYTYTGDYPYSYVHPELRANYIRNSVKAVVDAYDGTVDLYVFDEQDPIIACYRKIFPELFRSKSDMPESLLKHVRYPRVLFMVQAQVYCRYHMRDAQVFYNQEDRWGIPNEMYGSTKQPMEPYYVIMSTPDSPREEFMLIIPFTPAQREDENMVGWMAAKCDQPDYGQLLMYKFPKKRLYKGPWQIEALIDQDPTISEQLTLWGQVGSKIIRGNLLVIPIHDRDRKDAASLLYVVPLYLEAQQKGLPALARVIVAYGDQVVMRDTLSDSLQAIFGAPSATAAPAPAPSIAPATGAAAPPPAAMPAEGASADIMSLARAADEQYNRAIQASRSGDWATYGQEQKALGETLSRLKAASGGTQPAAGQ